MNDDISPVWGIALLALIIVALAIQGGAWGPSDLELFKRVAFPNQ